MNEDEMREEEQEEYYEGLTAGEQFAAGCPIEFCQFVAEYPYAHQQSPTMLISAWNKRVVTCKNHAGRETKTQLDDSPAFHTVLARIGRLNGSLALPFNSGSVTDNFCEGFIAGICQRWHDCGEVH